MPKFVEDSPYAKPEAGAKFLMDLVAKHRAPQGAFANVGVVNREFLSTGGSVAEYGAARDYAIAQGWIVMHESGCRFLPGTTSPAAP